MSTRYVSFRSMLTIKEALCTNSGMLSNRFILKCLYKAHLPRSFKFKIILNSQFFLSLVNILGIHSPWKWSAYSMAFLSQRLFISFEIDFTSAWQIGSYGGHAFWIDTLSSSILKFVNSLRMFLSLVIWDHSFDIMLKVTCNNNVFD